MEDLEAGGIRIRRFHDGDAEPFAAATHDPEILAQSEIAVSHTPESAQAAFARFDDEGFVQRAIADARTDALLGTVLLFNIAPHQRRCEVGFWLAPQARGRGAATAALALACDWAAREWGIERFDAHSHADNARAHAVLERNGFSREGLLRGWGARGDDRVDAVVFGRVAALPPPE